MYKPVSKNGFAAVAAALTAFITIVLLYFLVTRGQSVVIKDGGGGKLKNHF